MLTVAYSADYVNAQNVLPEDFKNYVCYRVMDSITVDGRLDEVSWERAPESARFQDIEGSKKPTPTYATTFKMIWNDEYLYIGATLQEPHIWATYDQRESVIFHENDFEVFIDPNGDTHHYFEIEINALNTVWDLLLTKPYRDRGKARTDWDAPGMKTATYLEGTINHAADTDQFWSVEMAIPWEDLQFNNVIYPRPMEGEQWRVNFSRVQWDLQVRDNRYVKEVDEETGKPLPENNWVWSPQGVIAMHQPETWGFIQFSGLNVGNRIEEFQMDPNEYCKWELRALYYLNRLEKEKTGNYFEELIELKLDFKTINAADIKYASNGKSYQASCVCNTTGQIWTIQEDGLITILK